MGIAISQDSAPPENTKIAIFRPTMYPTDKRAGERSQPMPKIVPPNDLIPSIEAVIKVFDNLGNRKNRSKARMKFVIEKLGFEEFRYRWEEAYKSMFGNKENEPRLTGKKISDNKNCLSMVATDGHRLAKIDYSPKINIPEIPGVIIPRKTINELCKLLADITGTIKINLDPNKIIFFINKSVLVSKLIDGNFPDYEKVIPNNNTNILKVDRGVFSMAVDRVSTIINEKSPAIKFKLLKNLMNISSVDSESGLATEDIITEYLGNQMEVGFNSKYILEMINNLEDDKITLSFNDTSSPVIATEQSNPDLIYVLMPMRV